MAVTPTDDEFAPALASHGRRIAAALLDGVVASAIMSAGAAAGFGVGLIGAGGSDSDGWDALGWVLGGLVLGAMFGFAIWLVLTVWLARRPGVRNGQTLGKQMIGIRVVRTDRGEIDVGWALLREIVAKFVLVGITASIVSTMLGFFDVGLLGLLMGSAIWYGPAFADEQHRALHDRLLNTRVVDGAQQPLAPDPAAAASASDDELWPASA
jgi:uncharacterized RDD family membrane protein YckC